MFLLFDKKNFISLLSLKEKIDQRKERILFYDLLDLLAYYVSKDKYYLNNLYGIKIGRRNYKYLITRYGLSYKEALNNVNLFIDRRFKRLFKLIPKRQIIEFAKEGELQGKNILFGGKDFVLIQRRFITQFLPRINFICYLKESERLFLGSVFAENLFYKKLYDFERKIRKVYKIGNVIKKETKNRFVPIYLKNCKLNYSFTS